MAGLAGEAHIEPRRRLASGKRRVSRDVVLPDVSNLPDTEQGLKMIRRQPLAERTDRLTSASGLQTGAANRNMCVDEKVAMTTGRRDVTLCGQGGENQGVPVRAAKIAAKAKIKSGGNVRRKRAAKVSPGLEPEAQPVLPSREEPMEIDNPALSIRAFEEQLPATVLDIDDHDDYFLSPEYAKDIVAYMRSREKVTVLSVGYLAKNPGVTSQMRGILMDWLIQVQAHEQLEDETLQLTVTLTDHYLAAAEVPLTQLQLVGVTALLLAAKFVERFPPMVSALCSLTANTYGEEEVLAKERTVLQGLHYDLGRPLPYFFLHRLLMVHQHDLQVERLASYVVDLCLPSIHFVPVLPSVLAASALYVSLRVWLPVESEHWTPGLAAYSGYGVGQLLPSARLMAKILLKAPDSKYQAARQKHSDEELYGAISLDPVLDNHPQLVLLASTPL